MPARISCEDENMRGEGGSLDETKHPSGHEAAVLSFFTSLSLVTLSMARDAALLPALLLPVAVHELGHLLALKLLGFRLRTLGLEAKGLMIRYSGMGSWLQEAAAALAGPLAGLLYGILLLPAEGTIPEWLSVSGSVSLMLTGFNLLPILPLDGGRALGALCFRFLDKAEAERLLSRISAAAMTLLLLGGTVLLFRQKSAALLAAGLWLLAENERLPLVKGRKLL